MTFNDKIDLYMKKNNYKNLKQLANASDIPYTTLRDFYDKKSADNSRLSTIKKLSTFMNCTLDYLADDDIDNPLETNKNNRTLFDSKSTPEEQIKQLAINTGVEIELKLFKGKKLTAEDVLMIQQSLMEELKKQEKEKEEQEK